MKTTRRRALLLGTAAAGLAPLPAPAQVVAKSAGDELEAAREAMKRTGEQLAKVELKSETEPAFVFRAG